MKYKVQSFHFEFQHVLRMVWGMLEKVHLWPYESRLYYEWIWLRVRMHQHLYLFEVSHLKF